MKEEFTEFRESNKSLKHECGQFKGPGSHMSWWCCGSILVSNTRGGWVAGVSPFTIMTNIFVTEFRENI